VFKDILIDTFDSLAQQLRLLVFPLEYFTHFSIKKQLFFRTEKAKYFVRKSNRTSYHMLLSA
ncbi:hypothetical protein, partial [Enterococcus sp.]|uniref:hypothetical protein n=1 Tax=Enterococcus sp. TaxID=35783 RepID=UPI0028A19315